jgi:hypothetical protein
MNILSGERSAATDWLNELNTLESPQFHSGLASCIVHAIKATVSTLIVSHKSHYTVSNYFALYLIKIQRTERRDR